MKTNDRIANTFRPDLQTALSTNAEHFTVTGRGREGLDVFRDKTILLSDDLCIAPRLRATIEGLITSGGGQVSQHISDADTLVCQYREGNDYRTASSEGKTVGNLPWLYHLIMFNAWTSPLRRLLHYPIARGGLPGFKQYRISLSNYNGEARLYLENLAKAAGCEFTKTMKMDNTHLITAHTHSEKCDAAREWNIHMVNHLWLEESYAKWQIQSVTNPRYVHFPPRTNLGEVVGQTRIDKQVLEALFFTRRSKQPPPERAEVQHGNDSTFKLIGRIRGNGDELPSGDDENRDLGPRKAQTLPRRSKEPRAITPESTSTRAPEGLGAPQRGTPASDGAKWNVTPSTTGSRSAKERAAARIHDLAPDIALYEKEKKRVGGVVFGRRRVSDEATSDVSRKRSISVEEESNAEGHQMKRARKAKAPPLMRLLVTGYTRWSEDEKTFQKDKVSLKQ